MADLRTVPTVAELIADPALALRLDADEAAGMLAQVGAVHAVLTARVASAVASPTGNGKSEPLDRLLTVEQVAERMGLTAKQVYARARRWGFVRRPSEGTLRFSERGLERFMAGKVR